MTYLVHGTPLEDYRQQYGLLVKREDLACPPPGPPFSKTRGVLRWAQERRAEGATAVGVLDTSHSQGGLAVAQAAHHLNMRCLGWYPVYKGYEEEPLRPVQAAMFHDFGAELFGLKAGRSAVLYHQAKRACEAAGGVMFPNALKMQEQVEETAKEVERTLAACRGHLPGEACLLDMPWLVSASSGTIAAGVLRELDATVAKGPLIVHLGYSRPESAVVKYIRKAAGVGNRVPLLVIDEGYEYKDQARPGETPPWPSNKYYDLKCFRWWQRVGRQRFEKAVHWSIG